MRLERHLVLNRWLHHLLGADGFEALKRALGDVEEGPGGDGQSRFFHALAARRGVRVFEDKLREYDARLVDYEERLGRARDGLRLKYFQYLALLYTEILLDRVTSDPDAVLADLNGFLGGLQARGLLTGFPEFRADDLRRMAFFLATGAGKTLLLHANLWQVDHYLQHGRHPESLVRRPDGRREFEGIYLVTPNEGLSHQHLEELALSGIEASHLVHDPSPPPSLFGPHVRVVEISKLADDATGDGLSIPLDALGTANLVFVDEGHKGTGSTAQTWKRRQKRLSADGVLLEYSATFAQAIGAAGRRAQAELLAEYGKCIVFDYSYRHFHEEGFGKEFEVLNLQSVQERQAHELLLGGLLVFYQQVHLYRGRREALRPYRIEAPLWVFLGSKVNAVFRRGGRTRSDVATAVAFLRRFLEDREWAVDGIGRILEGESGFREPERNEDVFQRRLDHLDGEPAELYDRICREVFHGRGGLEVHELKNADGELGLRTSTPDEPSQPYFAVVNIGDVSGFKKHLDEHLGIEVVEDRFTGSLFGEIERTGSGISILIGAKKFIEGWSSWRVSTMGLLNLGRGEGPQVIQLFGRGVRLRGKDGSLRRSAARPEADPGAPEGLRELETLYIFGWNADYLDAFRGMLEREEIHEPVEVPVRTLFDQVRELPVPRPRAGYSAAAETWLLEFDPSVRVRLDLAPRAGVLVGGTVRPLEAGAAVDVSFEDPAIDGLLDYDDLHADVLEYKARRGFRNLFVPHDVLHQILRGAALRVAREDARDPERIQEGALRVLTTYVDRFVARREREAESRHLVPGTLVVREHVPASYTVHAASEDLLVELRALVRDEARLFVDGGHPLPRMHVDRHLWTPLLLQPADEEREALQISPPGLEAGEAQFLRDLREFWSQNHTASAYRDRELFILRNRPGSGVGFFRRSGFYPDFIVWLSAPEGGARIRFVEPHGMHHGGLAGNADKIEAFRELARLAEEPGFRREGLDIGGYLVTQTDLEDIADAEAQGLNWDVLARDYRLLRQSGGYIATVLG